MPRKAGMTGSPEIITATRSSSARPLARRVVPPARAGALLAECEALDEFRRAERQSLRARAGAVLPLRHSPLPSARQTDAASGARPRCSLRRLSAPAAAPLRGGHRHFLARQQAGGPERRASPAPWPPPISGSASRRWPIRCAAACARCAATSGCSACGHPADHPLRIRPELLERDPRRPFPVLREATPVRMDLTHSGWSDIFFLGHGLSRGRPRAQRLHRPGGAWRATPQPDARRSRPTSASSTSRSSAWPASTSAPPPTSTNLAEVFDFAKDYLGLLKAAVIAAGIVPPGIEGSGTSLADLLARIGRPGPRPRTGQQRQRHPQGLAARGLDQPARLR